MLQSIIEGEQTPKKKKHSDGGHGTNWNSTHPNDEHSQQHGQENMDVGGIRAKGGIWETAALARGRSDSRKVIFDFGIRQDSSPRIDHRGSHCDCAVRTDIIATTASLLRCLSPCGSSQRLPSGTFVGVCFLSMISSLAENSQLPSFHAGRRLSGILVSLWILAFCRRLAGL